MGTVAASVLFLLSACAGSTTVSVNCPAGGGSCTISGNVTVTWAPAQLIDVSEFTSLYTTQNVSVDDGTYSATFKVYDSNHNLVAQNSFNYIVSGSQGVLADPSTVNSWLNANVQSGDSVQISVAGMTYTVTDPNADSGTITATAYDGGQEEASGTATFSLGGGVGGGCHGCKQFRPAAPPATDR